MLTVLFQDVLFTNEIYSFEFDHNYIKVKKIILPLSYLHPATCIVLISFLKKYT